MTMTAASIGRQSILSKFPSSFSFCFAYGSGVKKQLGYETAAKQQQTMIDMMFCVDDSRHWHSANLQMNPSHYSGLSRFCGGTGITKYQHSFGAKVYCNTLVPLDNGQMIKYGVVSTRHLIDDLLHWRYLYVAGRLHKPFEVLHDPIDVIQKAIQTNMQNAVHASLLLLPESFTFYDLFFAIANLSYAGDFRMIFGEKKDKVKNIVAPQLGDFYKFYLSTLLAFTSANAVSLPADINGSISQNKSPEMTLYHLQRLPASLGQRLCDVRAEGLQINDKQIQSLVTNPKLSSILDEQIRAIVWNSSVFQSLKNIPTAGLTKSVRYSWKKILKNFNM